MPTKKQHLQQARHNQRFATYVACSDDYPDWLIVAFLYEAIHLVDAYLDYRSSADPEDHAERFRLLRSLAKGTKRIAEILPYYEDLFNMGIDARYNCRSVNSEDLREAREDNLLPIERWADWQFQLKTPETFAST